MLFKVNVLGGKMKRFFVITLICALLLALFGCSLKVYKYLGDSDEKGILLDVEGVTYRSKPNTPWRPNIFNAKMIGVANIPGRGLQSGIYTCEGDTDRLFVIAIDETENKDISYYYRDDTTLPDFNRNNIDTLIIGNNITMQEQNIITDPQKINKVFALFNMPAMQPLKGSIDLYDMNFMNSQYKGIAVHEFITAMDGEYWIVNWSTGNEMYRLPQDLLEELVSKKMPTASEYIASHKK